MEKLEEREEEIADRKCGYVASNSKRDVECASVEWERRWSDALGRKNRQKFRPPNRKREGNSGGEGEPKRAHDATPHPAIVNESTMSRIMHNELFRVDALMRRTMMRARAPEHSAKGGW